MLLIHTIDHGLFTGMSGTVRFCKVRWLRSLTLQRRFLLWQPSLAAIATPRTSVSQSAEELYFNRTEFD